MEGKYCKIPKKIIRKYEREIGNLKTKVNWHKNELEKLIKREKELKKLTENLITYQRLLQTNIYSQLESQDAIKKLEREIKNYKKAMNGKLLSQKNFYITPDRLNSWRNQKLRIVYLRESDELSFVYEAYYGWTPISSLSASIIIGKNNMKKWSKKNEIRMKDALLLYRERSYEHTGLPKLINQILTSNDIFPKEDIHFFYH